MWYIDAILLGTSQYAIEHGEPMEKPAKSRVPNLRPAHYRQIQRFNNARDVLAGALLLTDGHSMRNRRLFQKGFHKLLNRNEFGETVFRIYIWEVYAVCAWLRCSLPFARVPF